MQKKNLKKGTVKRIDREHNAIVVLGPVKKETGNYMEKKLRLHCLSFDDDFKTAGFEFLRKLLVGHEVEFNDYDINGTFYADIFFNGLNVGYQIAREGLVNPHKMGEKTSHYYDDLTKGNQEARDAGRGQYKSDADDGDKKKKKKKAKLPVISELLGKEVTGYIDDVNYELDFQIYIHEVEQIVKAGFAGVQIPVKSKEHVINLRNFFAKNIYQRDRKFKIKLIDETGKLFLVEQNVGEESALMRKLFTNGWARLEQEASNKLETVELLSLKSLQDQGMHSGKGIWKDYKGKLPQASQENPQANSALYALLSGPAFEAVVVEVHSGDSMTIETSDAQRIRINLTNVKARSMGNFAKNEEAQPWAFEAKEALRKKAIGKNVKVKVDNVRNVKTEDREFEIVNATVYLGEEPVAVDLLQKGLITLVSPKMNDPSTQELQKYAEAAQIAETQKKGIHSSSSSIKRFWDLSRPENRGKVKEFNLENYKDQTEGVVEAVIAGTRFKIRLDKENCYFILSLNSVKSVANNKNMPAQEKWATESLEFSKRKSLQRTVKFEIDQLDKHGIAHGALFIDGKNIAEALINAGLAYVEKSFKNSRYINEYLSLESNVRAKKKGIWGEPELDMESVKKGDSEETNETKNVIVSEALYLDEFYLQDYDNPDLELVAKIIRDKAKAQENLAEPILIGTLALGLFDGQYYRVKILKKSKKDSYEVLFVDYGNHDVLNLKELKKCPKEIQKTPALAFKSKLEYIVTPSLDSMHGGSALELFKKLAVDTKLVADIKRREYGVNYVVLKRKGKEFNDIRKSINMTLVREGLAIVDPNSGLVNDYDWMEASKAGIVKNPDAIAALNNEDYE